MCIRDRRKAEQSTLRHELNRRVMSTFAGLQLGNIDTSPAEQMLLARAESALQSRISATVIVLGTPQQQDGSGSQPLVNPRDTDDTFNDVAIAFRTRKRYFSFGTVDGRTYARAAIPFVSTANSTSSDSREVLYVL